MKNPTLFFLSIATSAIAAQQQPCAQVAPVCYTQDNCACTYCLGPAQRIANAPLRPYTCNGDFEITIAGFYWKPHMEGLEYGIRDKVQVTNVCEIQNLNNLIDSEYLVPDFKWDFGFRLGLGYNTTCDGWDFGVEWTRFRGKASAREEAPADENQALLSLVSIFRQTAITNQIDWATEMTASWHVDIDLIDIELGRSYWVSKYLEMRPSVGIRIGYIDQTYSIENRGGIWSGINTPVNGMIDLDQDFKGVGVRGGLDLGWHLGCGWKIINNLNASIVYGRFDVDQDEQTRLPVSPFTKTKLLETRDSFRVSRSMLDLGLGIAWYGLFCDCNYGIGASLSWEQHLFFHQNQYFRVQRFATNTENLYSQQTGTLSTGGWTLQVQFDF